MNLRGRMCEGARGPLLGAATLVDVASNPPITPNWATAELTMTDLNSFGLRLLQFVEDSVTEALQNPPSRNALLVEADCALTVLGATLRREDPAKHAGAALFIDRDLIDAGKKGDLELEVALEGVLGARQIF